MVAHQAIGIHREEGRQDVFFLVAPIDQGMKDFDEKNEILIVIKNVLLIDSPHHNMINAGSAFFPLSSWHKCVLKIPNSAQNYSFSMTKPNHKTKNDH
jgi:hypothetical protein